MVYHWENNSFKDRELPPGTLTCDTGVTGRCRFRLKFGAFFLSRIYVLERTTHRFVFMACWNWFGFHTKQGFFLYRNSPNPSAAQENAGLAKLSEFGINMNNLRESDHPAGCNYNPIVAP